MQPSLSHTIPSESLAIAGLVKNKISLEDKIVSVILFGSRARAMQKMKVIGIF